MSLMFMKKQVHWEKYYSRKLIIVCSGQRLDRERYVNIDKAGENDEPVQIAYNTLLCADRKPVG